MITTSPSQTDNSWDRLSADERNSDEIIAAAVAGNLAVSVHRRDDSDDGGGDSDYSDDSDYYSDDVGCPNNSIPWCDFIRHPNLRLLKRVILLPSDFGDDDLVLLGNGCPLLEELEIDAYCSGSFLNSSKFPSLSEEAFGHLRILTVLDSDRFDDKAIGDGFSRLRSLEQLRLEYVVVMPLKCFQHLPTDSTLKKLSISLTSFFGLDSPRHRFFSVFEDITTSSKFSALEEFRVERSDDPPSDPDDPVELERLTSTYFISVAENDLLLLATLPNLKVLSLSYCITDNDAPFAFLFDQLQNLAEFSVYKCCCFYLETFEYFIEKAKNRPHVSRLDLISNEIWVWHDDVKELGRLARRLCPWVSFRCSEEEEVSDGDEEEEEEFEEEYFGYPSTHEEIQHAQYHQHVQYHAARSSASLEWDLSAKLSCFSSSSTIPGASHPQLQRAQTRNQNDNLHYFQQNQQPINFNSNSNVGHHQSHYINSTRTQLHHHHRFVDPTHHSSSSTRVNQQQLQHY